MKGFLGTFEILVRDHETSEVQRSTIKTCPFPATELISKNILLVAVNGFYAVEHMANKL